MANRIRRQLGCVLRPAQRQRDFARQFVGIELAHTVALISEIGSSVFAGGFKSDGQRVA